MVSAIGLIFLTIVNPSESWVDSPLYTTHDPIYINGNPDFTAENGVTGGTGTQSNPYIIEGWDINASSAHGIQIRNTDAYFIIRNCYVHDGGGSYNGIYFYNVWNGRIENTISSNNWYGVYLRDSSNNNISNTSANSNNECGILLQSNSNYNHISNNNALNNSFGIYLDYYSSYSTLFNNTLENDGIFIRGYGIECFNTHNIDTTNTANGKPIYYYKNQKDINIDGWSAGQIILANCTNSTIKNVDCSNASVGVEIAYCDYCSIESSIFNNEMYAIYLDSSNNNNIYNNSASNNNFGIYFSSSSNNNVTNNDVQRSSYEGLNLAYSLNNNITNNNVTNNGRGVFLFSSNNNNISINNVSSNNFGGIVIETDSSNNHIAYNNVTSNMYGITLSYSSNNNSIMHNNVSSNNNYGIYLWDSLSNKISNNNVTKNERGVFLDYSANNNEIMNNNIMSNNYGIYVESSSNNTISNNTASNNDYGIYLDSSSNNNIFNNNASNNYGYGYGYGIYLEYSSHNNISNNNVSNNKNGIFLVSSSTNTLASNSISNNKFNGIRLHNSPNNIVKNCTIFSNKRGFAIHGSENNVLRDNCIYENKYNFGIECDGWVGYHYEDIDTTNTVNGKPIYYFVWQSDIVVDETMEIGYLCFVSCSNITIRNIQIDSNIGGITLVDTTHSLIENCTLKNNERGIWLWWCANDRIRNCTAFDNMWDGIFIGVSSNNRIMYNNITDNWSGIKLVFSSSNTVSSNTASNNKYGVSLHDSSNNDITNNNVTKNGQGIFLDFSSNNNNISINNVSSSNFGGIVIETDSSNNHIAYNNVTSNMYGITLSYSSNNNSIMHNNVSSNNNYGIYLWDSLSNKISNNNVTKNECGVFLDYSANNNEIMNNNIMSNNYGIYLWHSSNNNVFNNSVYSNNGNGIRLGYSSFNTFMSNNISYNNCSVEIYNSNCENNIFHHNNFISGTIVNVIDIGVNTKWDDSYGEGNYWSNYTGLDDGSNGRVAGDGIGDTNIPHMGLDNYPLMEPVERPYTPDITPPVISSVVVSEITETSATITWTTDEFSESRVNYSVNENLSSNSTQYDSALTTSHSLTLTDLSPNTTYYFEVSSADKYSNTATDTNNSNYYTLTTLEDKTLPTITDVTAIPDPQEIYGYVNISADVSDNVNIDAVWVNITDPDGNTMGNFTMTHNLINDRYYKNQIYNIVGTYQFIIWANDTSNNWNFSSGQFVIRDTPPATPTGLTITDVPNDEGGALNITWDANTEPDLDHYTLYSNKTGLWAVVDEIPAGTEYYVDTGLTDVAVYYYNVSASDDASNESPQSATASGVPTDNLSPATPTGLTVTDVSNDEGGALNITWNLNTDDTVVYSLHTNKSGSWQFLVNVTHPQNWYVDTGLTNDVKYYYKISAWDEVPNESPLSDAAYGIPRDNLPPATPTGLAVTPLRSGDLNITWDLNTDDTQTYSIYSNKTGIWSLIVNVTHPQNRYIDTGLTSGTTYYYRISAWDEVQLESSKSEVVHGVSSPIGTISGIVKDKDDNAIKGASIVIYVAGTTDNPVTSTTTNSNGEYSIDIPSGTYDVKIEKSGYETQWKKDVVVTADQTTTTDFTLLLTTDILRDYWWLIILIIIVIVIIIIVALILKMKKPVEVKEEEGVEEVEESEIEEEAEAEEEEPS